MNNPLEWLLREFKHRLRAVVEAIAGGPPVVVADLADNYWGTSNPAAIAGWILDHNDSGQYEPSHWMIEDYEPFSPHEIKTESTTWGEVKTLFR